MRSSKSRSRNKSNRHRPSAGSGGNVVNRVFDSSGPEGKVRGTPQQIIDKYNQLARDAQLSDDRVAAENFQQHAEHYMRLLSEAQREQDARREEQDARREEQERQNRERQAERDRERSERAERQERESNGRQAKAQEQGQNTDQNTDQNPGQNLGQNLGQDPGQDPGRAPQPDVLDHGRSPEVGSGLVETPEGGPKKPARRSRSRKPVAKTTKKPDQPANDKGETSEAAE